MSIMHYNIPILAYHKVDYKRELGITRVSPQRFERQISFLKSEGYKSISPDSLIQADNRKAPEKPILITFDDGYEGVYNYAYPVLRSYGFSAVIFLTSGYIGKNNYWDASPGPRFRHLTFQQIQEMANHDICIGSHGVNHVFLTKLDNGSIKYETEMSKCCLEDALGYSVHFFSYPYGNYNTRVANFVRDAGYKAAFSLHPEILKAEYSGEKMLEIHSFYKIPRIAIYLIDSFWAFRTKVGYNHSKTLFYMQKAKNLLINRFSYASMLVNTRNYE